MIVVAVVDWTMVMAAVVDAIVVIVNVSKGIAAHDTRLWNQLPHERIN